MSHLLVYAAAFLLTVILHSCTSAPDALTCLRAANASALEVANANINLAGVYGTFVFVPVIDGSFIIERPTVTLERRRVNGVRDFTVSRHISAC